MIRAIALDDEPPSLEILHGFCKRSGLIDLLSTFTGSKDAFQWLQLNAVDLLFLDINMPSVKGIDFYKTVTQKPMVIFTTAYSEYAVESYAVNAIDYLLKPFTYERFLQAVNKARDLTDLVQHKVAAPQKFITLRVDYGLIKIKLQDILFIEGLDNYLKIFLQNEKPVVVRLTMKALYELLPDQQFLRVHRSYIVSLDHVNSIRNKIINIAGEEIPLGISYEQAFFDALKQNANGSVN